MPEITSTPQKANKTTKRFCFTKFFIFSIPDSKFNSKFCKVRSIGQIPQQSRKNAPKTRGNTFPEQFRITAVALYNYNYSYYIT
jgi:hypothetical protein